MQDFMAGTSVSETITKLSQVSMMSPRDTQRANEYTYSRKYIDSYIRTEIEENQDIQDAISVCVVDAFLWLEKDYYPSKQARLAPLREYTDQQMRELFTLIVIGCAYCQTPELYTSITAQLSTRLKWSDRKEAITTIAELLVIVAQNDLINIDKQPAKGIGGKYGKFSIVITEQYATVSESDQVRDAVAVPATIGGQTQACD